MDVADEIDPGGEFLQHALAAADAVGADDDLPVREPLGEQAEQFDQPLGSSAVVGIGRPPGGLGASLGQSLAVLAEAEADGPGEDLGRGPGGAWPEQEEDDPIVPPAEDFQGLAGHQGVVVHPRAEKSQAAFATQRVVAAQQDRPGGGEGGDEGSRQDHAEGVEGPGGVAAEAVEATPVSWADAAGGEEALGDEASAAGQDPAGDQFDEGPERGRGENGVEVMQQEKEGGVRSTGRLPGIGVAWSVTIPSYQNRARKPTLYPLMNSAEICETRTKPSSAAWLASFWACGSLMTYSASSRFGLA